MGRLFERMGAGSILFTDVDVEGLLKGINTNPISMLVEAVSIPVIASGGVTTIDDILQIKKTGAAGVIVALAADRSGTDPTGGSLEDVPGDAGCVLRGGPRCAQSVRRAVALRQQRPLHGHAL
jgi:hypothetical protein